jgi:hypothetical protein
MEPKRLGRFVFQTTGRAGMRKIGVLAVGGLVGTALTFGVGGVAVAAPTTTAPPPTASPSTTTPSTSTPSTKNKVAHVLTGGDIWRIVHPPAIDCAHAAKELKRVRAADAAAAKRTTHWQTRMGKDQKSQGQRQSTNAARRTKKSSGRVRGLQKLEQDGQALIRRIDAKCDVAAPTQ